MLYKHLLNITDLSPPSTGYFNYRNQGLYIFRNPARQWKCGFCKHNHEIYNPLNKLFKAGIYNPVLGLQLANAAYLNKFPQVDEAINNLQKNSQIISQAISRNILLSKSPTENHDILIWFKSIPCGFIHGDKFHTFDPIYEQEIEDELHRIGANKWSL